MDEGKMLIGGKCDLFACRVCRTKFGYEHQAWCELSHITSPGCRDCGYWSEDGGVCRHPTIKKAGVKK